MKRIRNISSRHIDDIRLDLVRRWEKVRPPITPVTWTTVNDLDVVIKDESKNVTGTYKAKHGWMMGLHYLQNIFPKKFTYFLQSTGNAALADFVFADMLNAMLGDKNVMVVDFFPQHYETKLLGPDSKGRFTDGKMFRENMERCDGGRVIQADFRSKYWGKKVCFYKMNECDITVTDKNSMDITEGFKPTYDRVMEEFVAQIKKRSGIVPKTLAIVQFGAGMLYDDSKMVVQSQHLPIDILAVSTGDPGTIADKICDVSESWQENIADLRKKGTTRAKNSGDLIYHVREQEMLYALAQFRELGLEAEPSGAAGLAMIPRIGEITKKEYDLIMVINTGNGIKGTAYKTITN